MHLMKSARFSAGARNDGGGLDSHIKILCGSELVKGISGKKPLLTTRKLRENIIGGYILTMDDRQIDQSVKGALNKLKLKFDQESK